MAEAGGTPKPRRSAAAWRKSPPHRQQTTHAHIKLCYAKQQSPAIGQLLDLVAVQCRLNLAAAGCGCCCRGMLLMQVTLVHRAGGMGALERKC